MAIAEQEPTGATEMSAPPAAPAVPPVGEQIRRARGERGMSQYQLAEALETSQSAVARLESSDYDGHSLATLRKAAKALGKELVVALVEPAQVGTLSAALPVPSEPARPRRGRPPKARPESAGADPAPDPAA